MNEIYTPEQLISYMNSNIEYGYIGKNNHKKYYYNDINFNVDWFDEYYLQSPEEIINNRIGVCWDKVEFEREWFEKKKYEFKTIFICFDLKEENNFPSHTFLTFKKKKKWYWFEESWDTYKGIYEYNSLKELIKDVLEKHFIFSKKKFGAEDAHKNYLRYAVYEKPKHGLSPMEFCKFALQNKKRL